MKDLQGWWKRFLFYFTFKIYFHSQNSALTSTSSFLKRWFYLFQWNPSKWWKQHFASPWKLFSFSRYLNFCCNTFDNVPKHLDMKVNVNFRKYDPTKWQKNNYNEYIRVLLEKKSASTILSSVLALLLINFISPVFPVYAVRSFLKNFHLPEIASDLGVGLYDYQKKYLLNIILWEWAECVVLRDNIWYYFKLITQPIQKKNSIESAKWHGLYALYGLAYL